jgi:hypothetical protein
LIPRAEMLAGKAKACPATHLKKNKNGGQLALPAV